MTRNSYKLDLGDFLELAVVGVICFAILLSTGEALWDKTGFCDLWFSITAIGWLMSVGVLFIPFWLVLKKKKVESILLRSIIASSLGGSLLVILASGALRIVGGAALASESTPLMIYHPRGDGSFETMTSQHWGVTNWKTKFYRSSAHLQRGKLEARIEDGSVVEIPAAFESYEYFLSPEAGYQKAIRGESGNISSDSLTTQTRFWLQGNPQSSRLSIEDLQKVAQERFDEEAKKIGYVRKQ